MKYQIFTTNENGVVIYARIDEDNKCRLTCTENYPEFQEWLAAGNTPLPAIETELTGEELAAQNELES